MSRLSASMHANLTEDIVKALREKEIRTVVEFIKSDVKFLEKCSSLTFKEILDIRQYFLEQYSATPRTGLSYYKDILRSSRMISTGSQNVDRLLNGGLYPDLIYEVTGLAASGKTMFSLTITKQLILTLKQNMYFLDTNHNFSAMKLKQMLGDITKEDFEEVMGKCFLNRIQNQFDLINSLYEIKRKLEAGLHIALIIIDSLSILFLSMSALNESNNMLNQIVNIMHFIVREYHVSFVVTNLCSLWEEDGKLIEKNACGKYWWTVPNVRLKLVKPSSGICDVCLDSRRRGPSDDKLELKAQLNFVDDCLK